MAPDDDPVRFELRSLDTDPDLPGEDRSGRRIEQDTGWGLAPDDSDAWTT